MITETNTKPKRKAAQRVYKLQVCAYMESGAKHPAFCIQVTVPPRGKFGQYLSPLVRRGDHGYMDLYHACKGKPMWLFNQEPRPLL